MPTNKTPCPYGCDEHLDIDSRCNLEASIRNEFHKAFPGRDIAVHFDESTETWHVLAGSIGFEAQVGSDDDTLVFVDTYDGTQTVEVVRGPGFAL